MPRIPTDVNVGGNGMTSVVVNGGTGTTSTSHPNANATIHHHDRENTISTSDHETNDGSNGSGSGGAATTKLPPMSIRRALLTYLFPIYMAWFGGLFCDLL